MALTYDAQGRPLTSFADVGLRLAFTAPSESLASQLQNLLAAKGYLAK